MGPILQKRLGIAPTRHLLARQSTCGWMRVNRSRRGRRTQSERGETICFLRPSLHTSRQRIHCTLCGGASRGWALPSLSLPAWLAGVTAEGVRRRGMYGTLLVAWHVNCTLDEWFMDTQITQTAENITTINYYEPEAQQSYNNRKLLGLFVLFLFCFDCWLFNFSPLRIELFNAYKFQIGDIEKQWKSENYGIKFVILKIELCFSILYCGFILEVRVSYDIHENTFFFVFCIMTCHKIKVIYYQSLWYFILNNASSFFNSTKFRGYAVLDAVAVSRLCFGSKLLACRRSIVKSKFCLQRGVGSLLFVIHAVQE